MLQDPVRLSVLAGGLSFGAIGVALMLAGIGVPFLLAAVLAAAASGLVQYTAFRTLPVPGRQDDAVARAQAQLEEYRAHTATLRHDLRGVLSPALMVSDRLVRHEDPVVQRSGQTVVRTVERATALLAAHKDTLATDGPAETAPD